MGIFDASQSSGGSAQSNFSNSQAEAYSVTNGSDARDWSAQQAQIARDWQEKMMQKQMEFNSAEAAKQREWEQNNIDIANQMANTVYTRSVENMKAAGINPIMAANFGLSGAGAGATSAGAAATTTLPSGYMGQTVADQHSASSQYSHGEGSGSSWNQSTSGLSTALYQFADMFGKIADGVSSGLKVDMGKSFDAFLSKFLDPEGAEEVNNKVQKELKENNEKNSKHYKIKQYETKYSGRTGHQGKGALGAGRGNEEVVY